jgi:phenylacetate-coenzyme A ligase PaaK-like adenylate-forming protein
MGTGAFQCKYGNYHVNEDSVYFEFLDENNNPVSSNEPGNVIITRIFSKGTPLIRYTGLDDIVTPMYERCRCGLKTQLIKHIEGRKASRLILPNGEYITSYALTTNLHNVMHRFKSYKILQSQIIQEEVNKIIIKVIIDEKRRYKGISINKLFNAIEEEYQKIFGPDIDINVQEVKQIKSKTDFISPEVISKV